MTVRLTLAQLNPVVGDIAGNIQKLEACWKDAGQQGADLVISPELFVTGYPPEDFALRPSLQKAVSDNVKALASRTVSGPAILVGAPWVEDGKLYNAALLLDGGQVVTKVFKHDLPNYGPFNEKRVYTASPLQEPVVWRGVSLGIMICEDMWKPEGAAYLREKGAEVLIALNGSPFEADKQEQRYDIARMRALETGLPLVYVNQWGGQDELVFEGASFVMNGKGEIVAQAKAWSEDRLLTCWNKTDAGLAPDGCRLELLPKKEASIYEGLVLAVRDYVGKNRFPGVLLGLSGGIDSALVAAVAVDALGAGKVRCVMMPSPYTSKESLEDAADVARALGCRLDTIPITEAMQAFEHTLAETFLGCAPDITEENIQSRCRGVILMAMSNKGGSMVLATGNKSEMATGYATLYGDMCGGYAPLKDVYKTDVYRLARWRNTKGEVFSGRILTKAPTAELRFNQKDQDSLPPYEVLDDILRAIVEEDLGVADIVKRGFEMATVNQVLRLLDRAEYKRRQAPPGPKVTSRHLSLDRRYPITNRFEER